MVESASPVAPSKPGPSRVDHHDCYRNAAAALTEARSSVGNLAAGHLMVAIAEEWRMLGAYTEKVDD